MNVNSISKEKNRFISDRIPWLLLIISLLPFSNNTLIVYLPQIILGFISVYLIMLNKYNLPDYLFCFWVLGIAMYLFGIVTYSGGLFYSLPMGLRLLFPAVFLTIGYGCRDCDNENKYLIVFFVLLIIELIFSILPNINQDFRQMIGLLYKEDLESYLYGFQYANTKRAVGSLGNPNLLCLYSDVLFSIILFKADDFKKPLLMRIIVTIIAIAICIETQSREGIIAFLIVVSLFLLFNSPKKKAVIITLPIDFLIVYFSFSFLDNSISRRMAFDALVGRISIWNRIMDNRLGGSIIKEMIGIGYQNARLVSFYDNIYVKYLVSGGLIGLFGFIFCLIILLKKSINSENKISFVLIIIWIVSSFACEFQETLKLSSLTLFAITFFMSNTSDKDNIVTETALLRGGK